ncbi:MAG: hypothetical protein ACRDNI_01590 [Gaiellaceae bacterium]
MSYSLLVLSSLVVVLLAGGLVLADRRQRLLAACIGILSVLAVGWVLAARAVAVDYRDADGFVDCWPYCTAFHMTIGATLFYGPVAAGLLLVVAVVLRARRRSSAARSS